MAALRSTIVQNDFSDGMVRDVAPTLISDAGVYDLLDGLLDEDGTPYRRGGTEYKSSAGLGSTGLRWIWDGYLLPGQRTVFANSADFGVLGADDKAPVNLGGAGLSFPKQSAVLQDMLFIGGGTIYAGSRKEAPYTTGTVKVANGSKTVEGSGTTWNTLVDAGMLFQFGTERVYVVASIDSTTKLTLRDPYEGITGETKAYTLSPIYSVGSDPYETWDYLTVCANRLVLGSGRTIKFTEINNPHTFENALKTTNEHTLPQGVEIVGLTTAGQTVLIFTTAGVWTLDGLALDIVDQNGNPQHRLQLLSSDLVLAGATGIAGFGQQLVVPAVDGIYLMDGISQPVRVSRPIDKLYRNQISQGYRFGKAAVHRGHYFLPVLDATAAVRDCHVCRLDRTTRSRRQTSFPWGHLTGDGGETTAFAVRTSTGSREPVLLGAQRREPSRVVNCSGFFNPSAAIKNDADGSTFDLDLITRDYETGSGTRNVIRAIRPRYELVDAANDGPTLKVYYSDGSLETGAAKWDEVTWDDFEWSADSSSFIPIGEGPVSDGRDPVKLRVNKRGRFVRFRVKSDGPAAYCALRSLELAIRPSGAVRR